MQLQSQPGFHTVSLAQIAFSLPNRYERLELMGCGTYSAIARAQDRQMGGRRVAIKKLDKPFQSVDRAHRAYRELQLLSAISHPNVINLLHAFSPQLTCQQPAAELLQEVYLVMPCMDCDLARLLADRGRLKCREAVKIAQGVLSGVSYLHSAGILHRDLKPSNVALGRDGAVKILDFGLARATVSGASDLTDYVCTRSYRSPEVLVSCGYGCPADVWSAGCILAECLLGRVLFPAAGICHLLRDICQLLGQPELAEAAWLPREAAEFIAQLDTVTQPEFAGVFAHVRGQAGGSAVCDLLRQLLVFQPDRRISAAAALIHPALAKPDRQMPSWTGQQQQPSRSSSSEPHQVLAPEIGRSGLQDEVQHWRALICQKLTELMK
ncbi:hypothetical protein BOX15_Mlig010828g1 [Macrostomum lignano]|uniref:Protein kinase domain-containing protein n=1 Tax=Macrostomum lignano TaxID=282301 RepID=A0A267FEC1_9PLAT|nr:hypothetical protein BOX15_Mlig010828g1 [Macrostomum lignano]